MFNRRTEQKFKKKNMKRDEIKNMMIVHNDNDFIRVWDWIGNVTLNTIIKDINICGCKVLEDSDDIEKFIHSLLPTAIEFIQAREDKYADYVRYEDIDKEEVIRLSDYFKDVKFKYNFSETDNDWIFGGSETLIIDLEKNESYIR
jgi:hypothetical protein